MHRHDSESAHSSAPTVMPIASAALLDSHPMVALSDRLTGLSAASELPGEWHNTVMSLRDAAALLIEAAEMIAEGGSKDSVGRLPTPERAVECALACIGRVYERGTVWPVLPLPQYP